MFSIVRVPFAASVLALGLVMALGAHAQQLVSPDFANQMQTTLPSNQPLLASFTLAKSYYLRRWYIHLVWMAAFALLTALALLSTSWIALRRAAIEEAHLRRLLQEGDRRKGPEGNSTGARQARPVRRDH